MRAAVVIERSPVPGRCLAVAMLAALSLVGIPRGADAASTGAYYELSNQSSQTGDTYLGPTWVQSSTAEPVDTGLQSIGTATVTASAAPGVLRTRVWSVADVESIPSTGVSEFSSAHAAAQFIDRITLGVPNPALIGTTVTVNASFLLNGSLSASYGIEGNNSANFDVLAQTVVQVSGTGITGFVTAREGHGNQGGVLTNVSDPVPSVIPVQFTAILGSATNIQYQLDFQGNASAGFGFRECGGGYGPCGAGASALVDSDFAHSLLWGGIASVMDASGSPIPGFTVSSESGFDYALAVPEPSALALVLLGGVFLAARGRRSRTVSREL